jgi:predicted transcriptional regulator
METTMSLAIALEDLALGEVTLEEGATVVGSILSRLDERSSHDLYEALRSWVWKTLEARRRDDELSGWMDLFSRASSRIENHSKELSIKIEGFMELLHTSVMTAGAAAERDPLERKHVKQALRIIYRGNGRVRRKQLMDALGLKAPNLSRVMTPLQDDGFVMREVMGREIFYRLTMKGYEAALPLVAHEAIRRTSVPGIPTMKMAPFELGNVIVKVWDKPMAQDVVVFCDHYLGGAKVHVVDEPSAEDFFTRYDAKSLQSPDYWGTDAPVYERAGR